MHLQGKNVFPAVRLCIVVKPILKKLGVKVGLNEAGFPTLCVEYPLEKLISCVFCDITHSAAHNLASSDALVHSDTIKGG